MATNKTVIKQTYYEIPRDVRNTKHDFRIAIFSYDKPFSQIYALDFEFDAIVIKPEGLTSLSFNTTTMTSPGGGSFTIVGGLSGAISRAPRKETQATVYDENGNPLTLGSSKLEGILNDNLESNQPIDIGSMFSNTQQFIKPMDYVLIFTKDVRTGRWYGADPLDRADVPSSAKPKYLGIITDINTGYNANSNTMEITVNFKSMLHLLEISRYAVEPQALPFLTEIWAKYAVDKGLAAKKFEETAYNDIQQSKSFLSNKSPSEIIKSAVSVDYPTILVGDRIEDDQTRGEAQSIAPEVFVPQTLLGNSNYDSKLNKFREFANNKDFEFYADEDGQLVWKLPTYARGINKKEGNFVSGTQFNPSNYDKNYTYHISDLISVNITHSDTELLNLISGPLDFNVIGLGNDLNNVFKDSRTAYFIAGEDTEDERIRDFGFLNIGLRPITLRNPIHYNVTGTVPVDVLGYKVTTTLQQAQMMYYEFKLYKNNISRHFMGTVTMIDDPNIKVGMPIVVPLLAKAGTGKFQGKALPAIFYITGIQRRYEYNKYPLLTLSLTHGRFVKDEFHNGIHLFDRLSSWAARLEPNMFTEVELIDSNIIDPDNINLRYGVLNFTYNDSRIVKFLETYPYNSAQTKFADQKKVEGT